VAMKRFLIVVFASLFVLTGCATDANSSETSTPTPSSPFTSSPSPSTSTPTAKPTKSAQPLDNPSSDPAAGSGAENSDGAGNPLARTTVLWGDYVSGTQQDIDALTAAGDCKSLDSQYGGAKANEESVRASSGHGADAILAYIKEALALAACS
jgi:PBP1b-binding outer membrane lipoprotein LpoB